MASPSPAYPPEYDQPDDKEEYEYRRLWHEAAAARDRLLTFLRNENYEVLEEDGTLSRAWPAEDVDRILSEVTRRDA